jgi:hypothetical protein
LHTKRCNATIISLSLSRSSSPLLLSNIIIDVIRLHKMNRDNPPPFCGFRALLRRAKLTTRAVNRNNGAPHHHHAFPPPLTIGKAPQSAEGSPAFQLGVFHFLLPTYTLAKRSIPSHFHYPRDLTSHSSAPTSSSHPPPFPSKTDRDSPPDSQPAPTASHR